MNEKIVTETYSVDMKYTFLYLKLGFTKINEEVFLKRYANKEMAEIFSDEAYYVYKDFKIPLNNHDSFVLIEIINRLLSNDFTDILEFDLLNSTVTLLENNKRFTLHYVCWDDFEERCADFPLYSSKLSGGLIFYKSANIKSVFSRRIANILSASDDPLNYSDLKNLTKTVGDFVLVNNLLLKYIGAQEDVIIPEKIEMIGEGAFWNNENVKTIRMNEDVKIIGGDAFYKCINLQSINIGKNVEIMGDNPFAGCLNLTILNESSNFYAVDNIIYDKAMTSLIHYPANAQNCSFKVPEEINTLGKHSFYHNNYLKKVELPKSLSILENNVFSDCNNIEIINNSSWFLYKNGALTDHSLTHIYHFSQNSRYHEYAIPKTIKKIGRNSFWNCKNLQTITFSEGINQIGYNPFAGCSNLRFKGKCKQYAIINNALYSHNFKELVLVNDLCIDKQGTFTIDHRVEVIGRNAFNGNSKIIKIIIPSNVKYIQRGAFGNCLQLQTVILKAKLIKIGLWAFTNCPLLKTINISSDAQVDAGAFMNSPTRMVGE